MPAAVLPSALCIYLLDWLLFSTNFASPFFALLYLNVKLQSVFTGNQNLLIISLRNLWVSSEPSWLDWLENLKQRPWLIGFQRQYISQISLTSSAQSPLLHLAGSRAFFNIVHPRCLAFPGHLTGLWFSPHNTHASVKVNSHFISRISSLATAAIHYWLSKWDITKIVDPQHEWWWTQYWEIGLI